MEIALKTNKITQIYYIINAILMGLGLFFSFFVMTFSILSLNGMENSNTNNTLANFFTMFNIVFAISFLMIGFLILICVTIAFSFVLIPLIICHNLTKKFYKTNNMNYIKNSLLIKGIFLSITIFINIIIVLYLLVNIEQSFLIISILYLLINIIFDILNWIGFIKIKEEIK